MVRCRSRAKRTRHIKCRALRARDLGARLNLDDRPLRDGDDAGELQAVRPNGVALDFSSTAIRATRLVRRRSTPACSARSSRSARSPENSRSLRRSIEHLESKRVAIHAHWMIEAYNPRFERRRQGSERRGDRTKRDERDCTGANDSVVRREDSRLRDWSQPPQHTQLPAALSGQTNLRPRRARRDPPLGPTMPQGTVRCHGRDACNLQARLSISLWVL